MRTEIFGGITIDRCSVCHGLLLDQGEMRALLAAKLGMAVEKLRMSPMAELMDPLPGHCVECNVPMIALMAESIRVDQCPACNAVFLDEGELAAFQLQHS